MEAVVTEATTKIESIVTSVGTLGVSCIGIGAVIAIVTIVIVMVKKH